MFTPEAIAKIERSVEIINLIDQGCNDSSGITLTINPDNKNYSYRITVEGYYSGSSISSSGSSLSDCLSNLRNDLLKKIEDEYQDLSHKLAIIEEARSKISQTE